MVKDLAILALAAVVEGLILTVENSVMFLEKYFRFIAWFCDEATSGKAWVPPHKNRYHAGKGEEWQ